MSDGRTFQGRKRGMSSHRRLSAEIGLAETKPHPLSMLEKCSLLDDMPLAFCVIELVFNEDGRSVDFIFRYCNTEMAVVEGVPIEEMLNRSFYKVFPNGDKKWLAAYADVALNGTRHTLHDYSPEIDKNLITHIPIAPSIVSVYFFFLGLGAGNSSYIALNNPVKNSLLSTSSTSSISFAPSYGNS